MICIICVIAIHTLNWLFPADSLWQIIQPVPIFLIILGFNRGHSFKRNKLYKLKEMYSFKYFKNMFLRLVFPLLLINLLCFMIDLIFVNLTSYHINGWSNTHLGIVSWGATNVIYSPVNIFYFLIGVPYFPGPGSFFVLILMQFIFIFPLIFRIFLKSPLLGLILCFLIDLCFQLIAPHITFFNEYHFLFSGNILRYFSVIGLGIWFTYNKKLFSQQNIFIIILAVPALCILLIHYWGSYILPENIITSPVFKALFNSDGTGHSLTFFRTFPWWGKANPLTYCFPALIFLMFMKVIPSTLNKKIYIFRLISGFIKKYSKLTYHIFLIQIIYFFINIPIARGISIGVNEFLFEVFIEPVVRAFGIRHSWEFDFTLLNDHTLFKVMIMKPFIVAINVLIISVLAFGFYKLDKRIKGIFKKISINK